MKHKLIHEVRTKLTGALLASVKIPRPFTFSGVDSALQLCDAIAQAAPGKLLVVTDKALLELGVPAPLLSRLEGHGIEYEIYDGVKPDPTFDIVERGFDLFKSAACDAVLSIGGGSSIDTAKGIVACSTTGKPLEKMIGMFKVRGTPRPHYCVPTTAGTASEVTLAAVLTSPTGEKLALADGSLVPSMIALDAKLTAGLPPSLTAIAGMDALTHAIESHLSTHATQESLNYSRSSARLILGNLLQAYNKGDDLAARQALLHGTAYGGIALNRALLGYVHSIAHAVGAQYHLPHGLAIGIVLPYVLEYSVAEAQERLADLAVACGLGEANDGSRASAEAFIEKVRSINHQMNIPESIKELRREDIPKIAAKAVNESYGMNGVPRYMSLKECCVLVEKMLP